MSNQTTLFDMQIGKFVHRVCLCSMDDIVDNNGNMCLIRSEIKRSWASIEQWRPSFMSKEGYAIQEAKDRKTHNIYVRYNPNFLYSSSAWIYNEFLKSAPRWFKVIAFNDVNEMGRFICFSCNLVERSDAIVKPVQQKPGVLSAMPIPDGLKF